MKIIDYSLEPGQINRVLFDYSAGSTRVLKIGSVRFEPGQRLPVEGTGSHLEDELSYIIAGSLEGESGGEAFSIGGGHLTLIPAGEEHWAVAGPEGADLIYVMVEAQ
jgi:quercetin dioxygenase-like cupin family protein